MVRSLQGLLHQGDALEVVLLPVAGQAGRVARGQHPRVTRGPLPKSQPGSCTPQPAASRGRCPLKQDVSCFGGQRNHPGRWLPHQRPHDVHCQELEPCPYSAWRTGSRYRAHVDPAACSSGALSLPPGGRSPLLRDEPCLGRLSIRSREPHSSQGCQEYKKRPSRGFPNSSRIQES